MTNSSIRHRKGDLVDKLNHSSSEGMFLRQPSSKFLRTLLFIIVICMGSFLLLVILNNSWPFKRNGHSASSMDYTLASMGLQKRYDAVVIDAGSTGSRVLAFTFLSSLTDNSMKLLGDELWYEIKPGLSSYVNDPKKGAESLITLLDLAKQRIPPENWHSTPLIVRATAGLRLLDEDKSSAILHEVKLIINKSGLLTSKFPVEIMDGKDEGIFSWFTSNYLLDKITQELEKSTVALDLGGGSTQLTYVPAELTEKIEKKELSTLTLFGKDIQIFTHSYLGLGLMATRAAVLSSESDEENRVHSACINPVVDFKWSYGDKTFQVKGAALSKYKEIKENHGRLGEKRPIANYDDCQEICRKYVIDKMDNVPEDLNKREIVAFSYYFDKAAERGLIDSSLGGTVTVSKILQEAQKACEIPNVEQPFACLDLTFIGVLLNQGYGIKSETPIQLFKKIDGHELSWALGLAFHTVTNL